MIYNQNLDRLMDVEVVRDFMRRHHLQGKLCGQGESYSLILYRLPYVVEFYDALIENYLEIYLSDLENGLRIEGSSALGCSLDVGLQSLEMLRARDLKNNSAKEIFLSEHDSKTRDLYSNLEAIDKLIPLIEVKGGLSSMRDGTFDPRFDFKDSVQPMWHGLKEKYLKCISNEP